MQDHLFYVLLGRVESACEGILGDYQLGSAVRLSYHPNTFNSCLSICVGATDYSFHCGEKYRTHP